MSIVKKRFTPEEGRHAALEAARTLLLNEGPQAVTLKAVAAKIGRTHANLLHHFGSAAELQKALAASIADRVCHNIGEAVIRVRRDQADPSEIVDLTFDAFGREGAGALASWMILSGNRDVLDPILEALHNLVEELTDGYQEEPVHRNTLALVLAALGHSLLGKEFAQALDLPDTTAREMATQQLRHSMALAKAARSE